MRLLNQKMMNAVNEGFYFSRRNLYPYNEGIVMFHLNYYLLYLRKRGFYYGEQQNCKDY